MPRRFVLLLCLIGMAAAAPAAEPLRLASPSGTATATLQLADDGQPQLAVAWRGRPVLLPSPLGVQLDRGERIDRGLRVLHSARSEHDARHVLVVGKAREVHERYRQLEIELADAQDRRLGLVLRAYDDGIALRYRLPRPASGDLVVQQELTGFLFPRDYACWSLNLGQFQTAHEGEFDPIPASRLRPMHLLGLPLVCRTGDADASFAIAEADLDQYAALYLSGRGDGRLGVEARLSPQLEDRQTAVRIARDALGDGGHATPWRVLLLGDTPGALIESNLITSLNPPTPLVDTAWIRPGKSAWDWWSGGIAPDVADAGMNHATLRRYIDHAAEMGLAYMLIDDGWYVGSHGNGQWNPDADITRAKPGIDLPALVAHGRARGVDIWLWAHWRGLEPRMDAVFARYQALGVKGVKVDFMDRDDQQMVAFFHRMMRSAADHRLMLNLHGAYRPTGLQRTWPHFLTQEGVLGAEYNKWSRRVTPTHNLTLPFTRMLLGPIDYTPGGFRNVAPAQFAPAFTAPQVMGTRAHQLAMYVVYESPLQMVADSPDVYVDAPGADFLSLVPTNWDETRVLAGAIGEYIVVARRHGRDWYLGAMSNEAARTLEIDLSWLGEGEFDATLWRDGETATDVVRERPAMGAGRKLRLALAGGGGAALKLSPGTERR